MRVTGQDFVYEDRDKVSRIQSGFESVRTVETTPRYFRLWNLTDAMGVY